MRTSNSAPWVMSRSIRNPVSVDSVLVASCDSSRPSPRLPFPVRAPSSAVRMIGDILLFG